jgi:hypothetical protein
MSEFVILGVWFFIFFTMLVKSPYLAFHFSGVGVWALSSFFSFVRFFIPTSLQLPQVAPSCTYSQFYCFRVVI